MDIKKIKAIGTIKHFTVLLFSLLVVFIATARHGQSLAASGDQLCFDESNSFSYEVEPISQSFKLFISDNSLHGLNISFNESGQTIILPKSFSLSSSVKAKVLDNKSSWETLASYYRGIEASLNSFCPDLVTQSGSPASINWQKAREAQTVINNAISDATNSDSMAEGGSVQIEDLPDAIPLGTDSLLISAYITGYRGYVWQLWINDCNGVPQPKLSTTDKNHPDRQINSDPYIGSYMWNTIKAETTACNHTIMVKVFEKESGNYVEGSKKEACIRVYAPGDKDTTSGCSGSTTTGNTNPVNTGTTFDGNIDANKFNFFGIKIETDLKTYLQRRVIDYIFPIILGFLALLGIIMGGVQLLMAQGDESKIAKGKKTILLTVIGVVIATLAITIYAGVLSVLRSLGYIQ